MPRSSWFAWAYQTSAVPNPGVPASITSAVR
ncbi:hypothetical protein MPTA5024_32435 [Microbispora sp. ATCC PTA-5024]|nr:hypothetical protein MPTA5024_32435 [Microbispora sp. ATCC PTA-5024]